MKPVLAILIFALLDARTEMLAAQCSSYYIAEINLVSPTADGAGRHSDFCWIWTVEARGGEKRAGVLLACEI